MKVNRNEEGLFIPIPKETWIVQGYLIVMK